ncbi:hypothetical protein M673_18730 (plasmid) [Aureimonas sp. AU20]|nr:hypothetical protein M673_18730 [Aureimonas sp. AU20]
MSALEGVRLVLLHKGRLATWLCLRHFGRVSLDAAILIGPHRASWATDCQLTLTPLFVFHKTNYEASVFLTLIRGLCERGTIENLAEQFAELTVRAKYLRSR